MLAVHLRINDAATGKPTAVRLRVSGPDGAVYPPHGRVAEIATGKNEDVGGHLQLGRETWYYTDGSCEVALPAGVPLRVQASKGPEYRPLDETVTLGPGQMALRYAVERWSDVRAAGWVPGDTRCHFIPPHAALLEAAAEDLDVVNLLACEQRLPSLDGTAYLTTPHLAAFSGQAAALEAHGRFVAVNTLNAHPALGRVGLLYSHRPVFPLAFGGNDASDDWSVCDWCDQCHRKGGLAVWVDPFRPTGGLVGGEALVAAVLGKVDAIEYDTLPRPHPLLPWVYTLWNAGVALPLAGGSGKDSNRTPLGSPRTYAHVPRGEPVTYKSWVEAVRAGRSFVTNGPLLTLDVNGSGPGATAEAASGAALAVRASASSLERFERLEVVCGGEVIAAAPAESGAVWIAAVTVAHSPTESGWVAARVVGGAGQTLSGGGIAFAHTSAVVVRVDGRPLPRRPAAAATLARLVNETRDWITDHGRFAQPKRKQQLLDRCGEALARLAGPA